MASPRRRGGARGPEGEREGGILFVIGNFPGGTPLWVLEFNKLFCVRSGSVILTTPRMNLPDDGHTSTSRCKGTAKGGTILGSQQPGHSISHPIGENHYVNH